MKKTKLTIVEKTPAIFNCVACACPSVFETNRGTYMIVGKELNQKEISKEIKDKIGTGETGIEVPRELVASIKL